MSTYLIEKEMENQELELQIWLDEQNDMDDYPDGFDPELYDI